MSWLNFNPSVPFLLSAFYSPPFYFVPFLLGSVILTFDVNLSRGEIEPLTREFSGRLLLKIFDRGIGEFQALNLA